MSTQLQQVASYYADDWESLRDEYSKREKTAKLLFPKKGEVWTCDFGKNVGSEINKVRPCIVIQNNKGNRFGPTTIVIPITSKIKPQPTHLLLNDTDFIYMEGNVCGTVLAEQIKSVSKARLGRCLGTLTQEAMANVEGLIRTAFAM